MHVRGFLSEVFFHLKHNHSVKLLPSLSLFFVVLFCFICLLLLFFLASRHPSSFHLNSTLTVGIGGVKPLDLSLLGVRDLDSDARELLFHIDSTPSNGRLVMVVNGKEVQLSKGDHFSFKDVQENRVRFVHSKEKFR